MKLFLLFCTIGFLEVRAHSQSTFGDWTYLDNGSSIIILKYNGMGGNIQIPSEINGKAVTTIGNPQASVPIFEGNTSQILHVTIPDSVQYISQKAFYGSNLLGITLPNSITSIESAAFAACQFLNNVIIPSSVTTLSYRLFAWCSSLTSISLPPTITAIDREVFRDCTSLQNITLPNQLISIGENAFARCHSLTSITIPNNVTTLGNRVFENCTNLTNVVIGKSVASISSGLRPFFAGCENLTSIEVHQENLTFESHEGVLYQKTPTVLFEYPAAKNSPTYSIKSLTSEINSWAFYNSKYLTNLIMPNSMGKIGGNAFHLSSIQYTDIPNSVTNIGVSAFSLSRIKKITLGSGINTIPEEMFYGCAQLESIRIPSNVLSIGPRSIGGVRNIVIENGLQIISNNGFQYISSESIIFPSSLTIIGSEAFLNSTATKTFVFTGAPPVLGTNVFNPSFNGGSQAKVFYPAGDTRWGSVFGGLPTQSFVPEDLKPNIKFAGITNGQFMLTWTSGLKDKHNVSLASTILTTTNLLEPSWSASAFLTNSIEFIDPDSLNQRKFYRVSIP